MKRNIFILLILVVAFVSMIFISVTPAYTQKGCCSYHDGVGCDAGQDSYDDSVICNDGWRDSSCSWAKKCELKGCCMIHGGVNCNSGPDKDMSVICNDGWKGSKCEWYRVCEIEKTEKTK